MKEQNNNERKEKPKKMFTKEKRFYLIAGISSVVALVAVVLTAVLVASLGKTEVPTTDKNSSIITEKPSNGGNTGDTGDTGDDGTDAPVIVAPEGMILPMVPSNVINEYGFYHNKTLNNYYEHTGMDFSAEIGDDVKAVSNGKVKVC